jgi:hypothetical protein
MKHIGLILSFLVFFTLQSFTQDILEEGKVVFELSDVSSDDPQMAMVMGGMKGMKTEFNFKKDIHSVDMDMGFVKMKILVDKANNKMNMLNDAMGNKTWIESTLDADKDAENVAKNTKVTKDKSNTKEIAGYPCYYFEFSNPDMPEMVVSGYMTEKIKSSANLVQGFQALDLDGFMLEYSVKMPQMTMVTTAKEIKPTADSKKFELNTKGYTKMSMEDYMEMVKKFSGGGF